MIELVQAAEQKITEVIIKISNGYEDMDSDGDTVVASPWHTVKGRKRKTLEKQVKSSELQQNSDKTKTNKNRNVNSNTQIPKIANNTTKPPTTNNASVLKNLYYSNVQKHTATKKDWSIPSFLEAASGTKRKNNHFSVRCQFSMTPRTNSITNFKRVIKELVEFAQDIDLQVMVSPWKDDTIYGPINISDLANPQSYTFDIIHYIDKPPYSVIQVDTPLYCIGIKFSINLQPRHFMKKWNMKRQTYRQQNLSSYAISRAPMQKSSTSYLIGIAAGSTEEQDCDIINSRLEQITGIQGIEVSFENISLSDITNKFWSKANSLASATNPSKSSRSH